MKVMDLRSPNRRAVEIIGSGVGENAYDGRSVQEAKI